MKKREKERKHRHILGEYSLLRTYKLCRLDGEFFQTGSLPTYLGS